MRTGTIFRGSCCAATLALALLTSCAGFDPSFPERPEAPAASDTGAGEETFPRLADVPARPNLSYDLRQEREIREGLVADRQNARYDGQELRREAGLRQVPPDPAVPLPAPARQEGEEPEPPPEPATVFVEEAIEQDEDDGSLGDFLDTLERLQPAAVTSPEPAAGGTASGTPEPASQAEPPPQVAAPPAEPPAAPPVEAGPDKADGTGETGYENLPVVFLSPPDGDGPLPDHVSVEFAAGSDIVEPDAETVIRNFAARLQRAGRGARVVAAGDPPVLAIDRARAVAIRLVRQGIPGNWIDIETGGVGATVVVYPEATGG